MLGAVLADSEDALRGLKVTASLSEKIRRMVDSSNRCLEREVFFGRGEFGNLVVDMIGKR